jgi:hypothetical protein
MYHMRVMNQTGTDDELGLPMLQEPNLHVLFSQMGAKLNVIGHKAFRERYNMRCSRGALIQDPNLH